jgi:hypothetical protein
MNEAQVAEQIRATHGNEEECEGYIDGLESLFEPTAYNNMTPQELEDDYRLYRSLIESDMTPSK